MSPHLCRTPAKATLGELWKCPCGQLWFFGVDFGAKAPEWTRAVTPAGVR